MDKEITVYGDDGAQVRLSLTQAMLEAGDEVLRRHCTEFDNGTPLGVSFGGHVVKALIEAVLSASRTKPQTQN
jgi:hypothetical protein